MSNSPQEKQPFHVCMAYSNWKSTLVSECEVRSDGPETQAQSVSKNQQRSVMGQEIGSHG